MKPILIAASTLFALTTASIDPSSQNQNLPQAPSNSNKFHDKNSNGIENPHGNPAPHLLPQLAQYLATVEHINNHHSDDTTSTASDCPAADSNTMSSTIDYIKTQITNTVNGFTQPGLTQDQATQFMLKLMNLQQVEIYLLGQVEAEDAKPCDQRNYHLTKDRRAYIRDVDNNYWTRLQQMLNAPADQSGSQGQGQLRNNN